jgi:hypothetical protein
VLIGIGPRQWMAGLLAKNRHYTSNPGLSQTIPSAAEICFMLELKTADPVLLSSAHGSKSPFVAYPAQTTTKLSLSVSGRGVGAQQEKAGRSGQD